MLALYGTWLQKYLRMTIQKNVMYGLQVRLMSNFIGVILYIMLASYPPFFGENKQEIRDAVMT